MRVIVTFSSALLLIFRNVHICTIIYDSLKFIVYFSQEGKFYEGDCYIHFDKNPVEEHVSEGDI